MDIDFGIALSDDPARIDKLGRKAYINALYNILMQCEMPMVVGLFGAWGTGKSTILHHLYKKLDRRSSGVKCLSYNAWEHQGENNHLLSIVHAIIERFELGDDSDVRKSLTVIFSAFSTFLLKSTVGLTYDDIDKLAKRYDDDYFKVQDSKAKLKNYFGVIINKITGIDGRLVIMIDDLDRCDPEYAVKFLDSIKTVFSHKNCIFILGFDRDVLLTYLSQVRPGVDTEGYLDKIVHLPFEVPKAYTNPIINNYLRSVLQKPYHKFLKHITDVLGSDNPRKLKKFANSLLLGQLIFYEVEKGVPVPEKLLRVKLIEYQYYPLYEYIARKPQCLIGIKEFAAVDEKLMELLNLSGPLKDYLFTEPSKKFEHIDDVKKYFFASSSSRVFYRRG